MCCEVVVHDAFYSYQTRYISEHGADIVIPADIDAQMQQRIQQIAVHLTAPAWRVWTCFHPPMARWSH
ncbi:D-alanyl-alanine synthetase A [Xanthomonas fragariae]|nr:D-alanyl-alanine synthetase A [Xanthomonas fragariae]